MGKRKPYERSIESDWWLKNIFYSAYMIREGSSIFITLYSVILAWGVFRLSQGEAAFNAWLSALQHPISIIFHFIILLFSLYHAFTWFSLAPKAVDLWINGQRLNDKLIVLTHYIAFIVISISCTVIMLV